ncbi:MAG: small multi-drug export protein [Candidatus Aenigmarchaeota archaeon]|nr:small multi-drug export protein [Candidatus Aenigmarchaeota archaeon]
MYKKKNYKQWKRDAQNSFDKEMKRDKVNVIAKILLPIIVLCFTFFCVYILGPDIYYKTLKLVSVYLFAPLGRSEAAVLYSIKTGMSMPFTMFMILLTESLVSLFIIWNFDCIKIIPKIRRLVKAAEDKSNELRTKYKWVKSLQFIGITLFVLLPLHFTGTIPGAIIGRMMKMRQTRLFFAVMLGSVIKLSILLAVTTGFVHLFF